MPEYYVDNDLCYCSLCDRYFPDEELRANHVRYALNHPKCNKCEIRFANGNALRVVCHLYTAPSPMITDSSLPLALYRLSQTQLLLCL